MSQDRRIGSFQLNDLTFAFPPFPLLSQWKQIESNTLCNRKNPPRTDCDRIHCACTHVIEVGLNKAIEVILVDEGMMAYLAFN